MIKSLRKRHLQIWVLWTVLIPVGIIVAWMAVPKKVTQELLQHAAPASAYHPIASVEKENYKINILAPNFVTTKKPVGWEYDLNLEFINKKESPNDSLLLYKVIDASDNSIDKQELLGRIEGGGTQHFRLKIFDLRVTDNKFDYRDKFVLYDIIKMRVTDSINFSQ
ncbi:MAG TPA: hypothetical protein VFU29_12035 [Chitinophagaceae bacterium]|nr:hypothetical protein [Chitinophagaceae bacterium]